MNSNPYKSPEPDAPSGEGNRRQSIIPNVLAAFSIAASLACAVALSLAIASPVPENNIQGKRWEETYQPIIVWPWVAAVVLAIVAILIRRSRVTITACVLAALPTAVAMLLDLYG